MNRMTVLIAALVVALSGCKPSGQEPPPANEPSPAENGDKRSVQKAYHQEIQFGEFKVDAYAGYFDESKDLNVHPENWILIQFGSQAISYRFNLEGEKLAGGLTPAQARALKTAVEEQTKKVDYTYVRLEMALHNYLETYRCRATRQWPEIREALLSQRPHVYLALSRTPMIKWALKVNIENPASFEVVAIEPTEGIDHVDTALMLAPIVNPMKVRDGGAGPFQFYMDSALLSFAPYGTSCDSFYNGGSTGERSAYEPVLDARYSKLVTETKSASDFLDLPKSFGEFQVLNPETPDTKPFENDDYYESIILSLTGERKP